MPNLDPFDLAYAIAGVAALLAGLLPRLFERRPMSLPIAFLALGAVVFALPLGLPAADPTRHATFVEHLTEVGVIVALMGAGLKIDRRFGFRRWSSTWRLLAITMPLSIAAVTLLGWWVLGLPLATALLLGALLAPTDPVLAADVQVGEPTDAEDSEDEVRFTLTSEAGLNDALAFPFVYAAIAMALHGTSPSQWVGRWVLVDVGYKLVVGIACGVALGWLLGRLFFRAPIEPLRLSEHAEGFVTLAVTFLSYGITELLGGYGFIAVFLCALSVRSSERSHGYQRVLHDFSEQVERLLLAAVLLLLGGAVVDGLFAELSWAEVAVGLILLFGIRPLLGWLALAGGQAGRRESMVIAFFGIRGLGSLYYLAYALNSADFPGGQSLWALTGFVVVASVVVHGILATPVMQRLDAMRERHFTPDSPPDQPERQGVPVTPS